jgi:hypothetical protein
MAKDLSNYLTYIRFQGGEGCWGYATCAIWDIMNELYCPNSPNMSMNLWLMFHRRRDLWEKAKNFQTPDGSYHVMVNPEWGFFQSFGNTTEGTEPHIGSIRWTGGFTEEGINEAENYRLKSIPTAISVSSEEFCTQLDHDHPIRLAAGPHVIAIVGYDEVNQTFKFVDSAGDREHTGGFGTFTFAEVDAGRTDWLGDISEAYIFEIVPPRPVPVAEIWVKHRVSRNNVNLWLSAEGSSRPKKKLWPPWEIAEDLSFNLHYKVRLPSEFIWPPSPSNRLVLDLYDSGAIYAGPGGEQGGGEVIEFRAAYGMHILNCEEILNNGPIHFHTHEHKRFYLPA